MMKNNQMFQRLGLSALASLINNTSSVSKGDAPQGSGSLYDGQDSGSSEQEEVSQRVYNTGGDISARGTRRSKRMAAPEQPKESTRVTRQRSAATKQVPSQSLTATTGDALESLISPTHDEDQINTVDEGALTTTEKQGSRGKVLARGSIH